MIVRYNPSIKRSPPCSPASAAFLFSALLATTHFAEEPSIKIGRDGGKPAITFKGVLLKSETAEGPWTILTNAASPQVVEAVGPQQFFMAAPPLSDSIFAHEFIARLKLAGPFQAHFDYAFAGMPDGIFPPVREKEYFDGELSLPGLAIPVTIRVRGNSSLQECPFPKLKFKVSREIRPGTPFAEARELDLGTHCAEGGWGSIGRLREQKAVYREVLAYEVLHLLEFTAPKVRRALIEYHDTTPATNATATVGWRITRNASLLEDTEVVAERLGGRALADTEAAALPGTAFAPQTVTDLQFFNALIGNWDYAIATDSIGVWNIEVIELPTGTTNQFLPVPGDFDLASWVTGVVRRIAPHDYHPELPDVEREALYALERIRQQTPADRFAAASQRFLARRDLLASHAAAAVIEEEGRTNALRHLAAFYAALEAQGEKSPEGPPGFRQP